MADLVVLRLFKYKISFDFAKAKMIYSENTSFASTPLLWQAFVEISLNLVHPNPYLGGITFKVYNSSVGLYVEYEINDIISVFAMVVKFYYMVKQSFLALEYNSNKMQRLVYPRLIQVDVWRR